MNRFRNMLRENRIFILTLVAFNLYTMTEGHNFVYAHEVRQQKQDRDLRAFSSVFGIPVENLRGHREPFLDRLEPRLSQVEELVRGAWESVALPLSYLPEVAPASEQRTAAASPQEPSGPSSVPRRELDPRLLERLQRATQSSDKERSGPPVLSQDAPLPWRQVEKKARTEKAAVVVDPRAASSALAPASVPRRAIPKDAPAPEIVALAHSLGDSPGRIFRFVHDEIDFDPKWGADKSPLGTLEERRGSSWDQAWLLQHLLTAAGVDARLEWGEVEIATPMLTNITGVDDAFRAGDLLTTAGVPIVLFVDGSRVVGARMSHVWVKAHLDYIPNRGATPGPGDTWVRLDPSLKRFDVGAGVRLDEEVPFDLGEYLQSGTLLSPRAFYEDALQAYVDANNLGVASLEELKPSKSLIAEAFPFVPGTLRAKILTVAGEATDVPATFQQQLELQLREAGGAVLVTWSTPWPAVYGQRLELAWPGATSADQSTLDLNGGVFATPPFEVDLRPVLRVDGADVASGEAIGSAEDVELLATLTPPQGSPTVAFFELFAGEHAIFTVDFGRIPQETVDRYTAERDAATDANEEEAWALALAGAVYLRSLSGDLEHLAALRYRRLVEIGNVVLAVQRGAVSTAADGTPLTFAAAPPSLDLGSMVVGLFPADGVAGPPSTSVSTLELLGSQGSAREGESLTQALGGEHLTAVGFLTRAVREGQTLTRVDAANVDAALAAAELSSDAEASVRAGVSRGLVAWISQTQLPFDTWDTTGYVVEDPTTGAGGYFVTFERLAQGLVANIVFHSPQDLDEVTAPIDVVATLEGEEIESWTLAYRAADGGPAVELASGIGTFANATLAQLDPTLLLNGLYDIVLTARDAAGQSASEKISVAVEGQMKIGNFSLSFTDLSIPLSGLDLDVIRTYDSRDNENRDFGFGWTLDIKQGSYRNNRTPGRGWQIVGGFLPCQAAQETRSHLTTVRLSDREIYRFRLQLFRPAVVLGGCFAEARFDYIDGPLPGATLQILGNTNVIYQNGSNDVLDADTFEVFEPQGVRLRTRDGRVFDIDLQAGVERVEDANNNSIQITRNGITHSDGTTVVFVRDAEQRITAITDPLGNALGYTYDAAGDLVTVTDQAGNNTSFTYDGNHGILDIQDPLGRMPVRNEYDPAGRLIRTIDANGNTVQLDHDLDARQEVVTDRLGNVRVLAYDERGNMIRETDGAGEVTDRTFDAEDNLLTQTDPLGNVTTRTYDANNNMTSITDPLGNTVQLTYNARGQILTATDARGGVTSNTYDAAGNLLSTTDGAGGTTSFTYDARGHRLTETDAEGNVTRFEYDSSGRMARKVDALGAETSFTYDAAGNHLTRSITRTTPSATEILTTSLTYDDLGRVTSSTDPLGNTTSLVFDAVGNTIRTVDRLGRAINVTYDDAGRATQTVFADGSSETQAYDAEGRLITHTDSGGQVTQVTYDAEGRSTQVRLGDGSTVSNTYDAAGRVIATTNARGHTMTFEYDAAGRKTKVTNAAGDEMRFTYDANGNRTSLTDGNGNTINYQFDAANRVTRVVFADGSFFSTTYDAMGRRLTETDQAGRTTRFAYDAVGRLTSVTDPLGQVTGYAYDETGARVSQTDANGHTTTFEYDAAGRLVRRTLPAVGAPPITVFESMAYDAAGNRVALTRFDGSTLGFAYDSMDRLIRKTFPDGSETTFTYNAEGHRASVTDARGTTTYSYDDRGRLSTLVYPDSRALSYGYDGNGNRTALTAQIGAASLTTTYSYDELNRLAAVTDPDGRVYTQSYDANGNRASLAYPNGIITTYTYDALNRLSRLVTQTSVGDVVQSYLYTLDAVGNRTRIEEADGRVTDYTYDDLSRLTVEQVSDASGLAYENAFTYDPVGNRLAQVQTASDGTATPIAYTFDDRDRIQTEDTNGFTWDANGDLFSRSGVDGASYTWDFEDRLSRIDLADGTVVEHTYDADGNLVGTRVTPAGGPTEVFDYLVDPSGPLAQVVAESDGSGSVTAYYFRGDDLLSVIRGPGVRYYHADGLGSIRRLTDGAGAVTDSYAYAAFGELLDHTGSDVNPFLFVGEQLDPNSRFYYLRARWMDPELGRFASFDRFPGFMTEPQSLHKYVYAENNPVNRVDPLGQFSVVSVAITAMVIGLLATGIFGVTAHVLALKTFPKDLDLFNPDAWIVGFSWTVPLGRLVRWIRHPVAVGLSLGLAFAGFTGALEMLIPRNNPSRAWVYYAWGFTAGDINRGKVGLIPTPYVGAAYNVPDIGAYTGPFFCTGFNGRLAARKLGFPVNFCGSNAKPGRPAAASITLSASKYGRLVTSILRYQFLDTAYLDPFAGVISLPEAVDKLEGWASSLVLGTP